ncbi:hypothetical protein CLV84_2387 [Neolewinella xylanilytica]|uniref:Uncharacterized protein n=1 Tax=Neolewinella xylanilytica TaxID=1514080 RepID=A0A2S6I2T6_9BACT|nr:hypothetical protein [Neolewinella xylanilytica]PPK85488.1 hypothetical protein CLV84_2387 [Neolewinella xylanilytica]
MASNRWFQQLQTIFYALLMAQLIYAVVVWFLIRGETARFFMDAQTDLYVLAGYAVCMVGGAWFLDQFRARTVAKQKGIRDRAASSYRATVFIRLAILESATLLITTVALLTNNYEALGLVVLMLGAFWYFRPRLEQFADRYI